MEKRAAFWLLGLVSLGACNSSNAGSHAVDVPPSGGSVPTAAPADYPVGQEWRPTYGFFLAADDEARVHNLWQAAIGQCMEARGAEYTPLPAPQDQTVLPNPLDEQVASTMGYHWGSMPGDTNPNDARVNADAGYAALLEGDGSHIGCVAAGTTYVYGSGDSSYIDGLNALSASMQEAQARWSNSEERVDLVGRWSRCMANAGYSFTSPDEARGVFSEKPTVSAIEIATRMADLACDRSIGLTVARSKGERVDLEAWAVKNEGAIETIKQARTVYLAEVVAKEQAIANGTAVIG